VPFGQEISCNLLHIARVYAAVANGGRLVTPHVVRESEGMQGGRNGVDQKSDGEQVIRIANGHPLAAVTGNDRFRDAAQQVYVTGSFWCSAVPMSAAVATINKLRATGAIATMEAMGQRLREGLELQARAHDLPLRQTGPVQMPMIMFDDDPDFLLGNRFVQEALRRGVYMHPWHNMFLSAAHQPADIDRVLEVTDAALKQVAGISERRQPAKAAQ